MPLATSVYNRLLKNTLFVSVGGGLSKVVSFLMLPLYTRWLSVGDYGLSDILTVYSSLILGVCTLCIAEAIFVFPKGVTVAKQKEYFSTGLIFTCFLLLLTAIAFYIYGILTDAGGKTNSFYQYRWYIYAIIVTSFFQLYTQQFAQAINKIKVYSFAGFVYTISLAGFSFLLVPKYKVDGYIMAMVLSNCFSILYTIIFSKSYLYFSYKSISCTVYKELLKYSIPLIPNGLMWWLIGSLNRPIIESSVGLVGVGIFAIAQKFPSLVTSVFNFFGMSWQISLLEEYGKSNFVIFYNRICKIVAVGLCLIGTFIAVFSDLLVKLISTPDYYPAKIYIPLLCLSAIFTCIGYFVGGVFSVVKKSKYFFYSSVFGAAIAVFANWLLIPRLGLYGAALSMVLSFFAIAVVRVIYADKIVHINGGKFYASLFCVLFFSLTATMLFGSLLINCLISLVLFGLFMLLNKDTIINNIRQLLLRF